MKITKLLVVVFVIVSSLPVLAQQTNANAQQNTSAQAGQAQASGSGAASANASRSKHNVQAQGSGSATGSASLIAPGSSHRAARRTAPASTQPMRPSNPRAVGQGRPPQTAPHDRKSPAPRNKALSASSAGAANGALSGTARNGSMNAAGAASNALTGSANRGALNGTGSGAGNAVASGAANGRPGSVLASTAGAANGSGSTAANAHGLTATASGAGNAFANSTANLQPVNGELLGKLDSKSAKVGQQVVVKTTQAFRTADGVVLPKGTHLIGHVTSVRPHRSRSDNGDLGLEFDHALLKGGRTIPIHSVIQSVAPPASALALASAGNDDLFADSPMGGGMIGGGAMGGGGLVGGRGIGGGGALAGGAGALASAPSRAVNTSAVGNGSGFTSAGRNTLGGAGNLGSNINGSANNLRGTAAGDGLMAAHATAIPGVMLAGDATGMASGTLTAARKNVHLDSGTQMVLGIAAAAQR